MSNINTLVTVKKIQLQKDKNFEFFGKSTLSISNFRLSLQMRVIIVNLKKNNNLSCNLESFFWNLPSKFESLCMVFEMHFENKVIKLKIKTLLGT